MGIFVVIIPGVRSYDSSDSGKIQITESDSRIRVNPNKATHKE